MNRLPPHKATDRIGLFGGSFNPAHEGHRHVALYALRLLKLDFVWWLVSPQNPLKDSSETEDYGLRLAQTTSMAAHPQFIVTDFEKQIESQYTAQTLAALKAASAAHFVWIMGADSLAGFDKWRDWQVIINSVPIAVFARPGYTDAALHAPAALQYAEARVPGGKAGRLAEMKPPAWAFLSMPLRPESSTAIRAAKKIPPPT